MKKIKITYILLVLIMFLVGYAVFPTYAKFSSDYTTKNDVVGLDFNFDISISNIEEYQEIKIPANNHKAFNVEITNSYDNIIYYGIWYKMITPKEKNKDIIIARENSTEVPTYGSIEKEAKQTVSLVIINNTNEMIKVAIGVGSSITSTKDIEYLNGKHLINEYANIPINKVASTYIKDLYHDGNITTVNIANDKEKPKLFLNEEQSIMLDNNNEYRYYGINPNNYISFNNELWRIISVSIAYSDTSKKIGAERVKIIKDNPIGIYSWNSSKEEINNGNGTNEWTTSTLNNILNNLYYNSKKDKCINDKNLTSIDCDFTKTGLTEESKKLIDKSLFYLGGVDSTKLNEMYANDYYNMERGTNNYNCTTTEEDCPRSNSNLNYVGLIYPSDYAYSINNITTSDKPYNYKFNINTWLKLLSNEIDHEYTITPLSNSKDSVININYNFGNITNNYYLNGEEKWTNNIVSTKEIIRPVVYLKDNVTIVEGTGTKENPYTITLTD